MASLGTADRGRWTACVGIERGPRSSVRPPSCKRLDDSQRGLPYQTVSYQVISYHVIRYYMIRDAPTRLATGDARAVQAAAGEGDLLGRVRCRVLGRGAQD
jgi:hypothetical protein